jgi:hypothetical protein
MHVIANNRKYKEDLRISIAFKDEIKSARRLTVFYDRYHVRELAYKIGPRLIVNMPICLFAPIAGSGRYEAKEFLEYLDGKIDKLRFDIEVAKALLRRGIVPTFSSVSNLVLYIESKSASRES